MSWKEMTVFGLLSASVGLGLYDLATSPWGEVPSSPDATIVEATTNEKSQDGQVKGSPDKVGDEVTKIKFGAPPRS